MQISQVRKIAVISCIFTLVIGQKVISKDSNQTHNNPLALTNLDYGSYQSLKPIGKRISTKPANYVNSPLKTPSREGNQESISTKPVDYENSPIETSSKEESSLSIEVKAFLDTIAWAEVGTADDSDYQILVFGGKFQSFSNHPRIKRCAVVNSNRICSTAAGRYQILDSTWDGLATKLGLTDFSPESQDAIAIALINERGALEDVENGRFEEAVDKVSNIWASLPGNDYNQNPKSIEELRDIYNQFIEFYYSNQ